MKKIGIMGGTFNPIHNGHILLAEASYRNCNLDEIWFMPSGISYLKEQKDIVSADRRMEMVKLAVEDIPHFSYCDIEINRKGNTYTVDTLKILNELYNDYEFYFIMGADSFIDITSWKEPEVIMRLCTIISAVREDIDITEMILHKEYLEKTFNAKVYLIPFEKTDISSSNIRKRLSQGLSVKGLLPEKVIHYIQKESIYMPKVALKDKNRNFV